MHPTKWTEPIYIHEKAGPAGISVQSDHNIITSPVNAALPKLTEHDSLGEFSRQKFDDIFPTIQQIT